MKLIRLIARPMLAALFVVSGIDAVKKPAGRAALAGPFLEKLAEKTPIPNDPELLVKVNGAVMAAAGASLSLSILPRLSAVALVGTLVPTTLAAHPYWTEEDPAVRGQQRVQFLKNLGLLGGLLLVAAETRPRAAKPTSA